VSEFKFNEAILLLFHGDLSILPTSFFASNAEVTQNQDNHHWVYAQVS